MFFSLGRGVNLALKCNKCFMRKEVIKLENEGME